MKIEYRSIILRDMLVSDIEDELIWQTQMVEWQFWDSPESQLLCERIDEAVERQRITTEFFKLEQIRYENSFRWSLEIDTIQGVHIGSIDTYWIEEGMLGIGISICHPEYWGKGYGRDALEAYLGYHRCHHHREVYLETWSGNQRMMTVAEKLGFKELKRTQRVVKVGGEYYDGVLFYKNLD